MKKTITINSLIEVRNYVRIVYPNMGMTGLAAAVDSTYSSIYNTLTGKSKSVDIIRRICDKLEIDPRGIEEWKDLKII